MPKSAGPKANTKSELVTALAADAKISKAQAAAVLEALSTQATKALLSGAPFQIPGLVKFKTKTKPATTDRAGVNPFTKQPTTIKGKPESLKVSASVGKGLKAAIGA